MPSYLRVDAVRRLAHQHSKKLGSSYVRWLNERVEKMVSADIHRLGSRTILNAQDAEIARGGR